MAVALVVSTKLCNLLLKSDIDFDSDDIRAVPSVNAYTPNIAHDFADDITNEVTTNGGSRIQLTSQAVSNGNFDAADLLDTASGGSLTIRSWTFVLYQGSTGDADREWLWNLKNDADLTAADGFDVGLLFPSGIFNVAGV